MYTSRSGLNKLHYGYDSDYLYFRVDQVDLLQQLGGKKGCFELRLSAKETFRVRYCFGRSLLDLSAGDEQLANGPAACEQVMELAVPLLPLGLSSGDIIHLSCHVYKGGAKMAVGRVKEMRVSVTAVAYLMKKTGWFNIVQNYCCHCSERIK